MGLHARVAVADLMAIVLVSEGHAASAANFPKSHPLHLRSDIAPCFTAIDLALLTASRVPWHPPSNSPLGATIIAIHGWRGCQRMARRETPRTMRTSTGRR